MPNPKTDKNKNRKNITIDFCYSNEDNSSNRNLLKVDNASNKMFSNDKNKEKLILISKKAK